MSKMCCALLALLPLSCGGPVDQFWIGEAKDCISNGVAYTGDTDGSHSIMVLEGPITALPKGYWGTEDKHGNKVLYPFKSATYIGPILKITVEFKTDTGSWKMEGNFTRGPLSMNGDTKTTYNFSGLPPTEGTCEYKMKADR